jgi:hypothetical protein
MNFRTGLLLVIVPFAAQNGAAHPSDCAPTSGAWEGQADACRVLFEVASDGGRVIEPHVYVSPFECDTRYVSRAWHWGQGIGISPGSCTCTFIGICDTFGDGSELTIRFVSSTEARVDFEYRNETALCATCPVFQDLSVQPVVAVEPRAWAHVKFLYR